MTNDRNIPAADESADSAVAASPETAQAGRSSAGRGRRAVGRSRRVPTGPKISDVVSPIGWIKMAVLGALLILLYRTQCQSIFNAWIHDPNWSHGFLIPLFSLYFLYQRRQQILNTPLQTDWLGLPMVLGSIFVCVVCIYPLQIGYLQQLAILSTLIGLIWVCCGWRSMLITWLPTLYLVFAIPLPQRLYESLTMPMRSWAAQFAAATLDLIPNLEAEARNVIIQGTYNNEFFQLSVAEACAGMRLMMAFVALGVAMAYLSERPIWHRVILVLSTLPIAIFCNFIRVTVTGIFYILVDERLATGSFHTMLGLFMLPLAFLFYWLITLVLNNLYVVEHADDAEAEGQQP